MPEELTYSAGFAQGVAEEMATNPDIFVIGTDLVHRGGHWAQIRGLVDIVGPGRVFDSPISEAAMVALGVGAAMAGMHPIVDLNFVDFSFGAMDEIANQAAKIPFMLGRPVPLVIRATAGVAHGGPQHNNSLESYFMNLPGVNLVVPAFPYDVKGLVKTALRTPEPVIFLMHKRLTGIKGLVGGPDDLVPLGRANVVRPGTDCTIITYGGTRNVGECIITVDDARGDLAANANVTVTVTEAKRSNVLSIPREALHTDGARNFVYRIVAGKLEQTPVQLGSLVTLTNVEIASGLQVNDLVVLGTLNPGKELSNGLAVKPVK